MPGVPGKTEVRGVDTHWGKHSFRIVGSIPATSSTAVW